MKSNVYINDQGFVYMGIARELDMKELQAIGEKYVELTTKLEDDHKPINVLIDMSESKYWDAFVIPLIAVMLKNVSFRKTASFGSTKEIKNTQEKLIAETHMENKSRLLDTKEEAEAWLAI